MLDALPQAVVVAVILALAVVVGVAVWTLTVGLHGRMIARMFDSPGASTCAPGLGPVDYLHLRTA